MKSALDSILAELSALDKAGLRRRLRTLEGTQASEIRLDARSVLNFGSNNYLGLAGDALLTDAATAAMHELGFGAGASRLLAGNLSLNGVLERRIAQWLGTESALLFSSGYHANVGVLSALLDARDVVFSDQLNHASVIDGCRLSGARIVVFRHGGLLDLEEKLRQERGRRRLVVTDSIFSMDGDAAPLAPIAELSRRADALFVVDEAHAIGVVGPDGAGMASGLHVDLRIGTLGKALGGFGAYVAGPRPFIDLIANRARSFLFTTALPVPVVAAAHVAVNWVDSPEGTSRRDRLRSLVSFFHRGLADFGLVSGPTPSHIVPVGADGGTPEAAMRASAALFERGIYAPGIRPPTVPAGTARLRFSLMATHTEEQLARTLLLLAELRPLFQPLGRR